ncbi:regulator of nonsense transcripts 3B [Drosophila sechellia]|uniref:GM15496 n=2 Tax=Drosophila sechellia TaxID=7238 RepID=B4I8V8_DROSE|nr:regulator of nonsense transcripts 3B [Drosophila sechellia]EDW57033.1 GM15496 [Drosophila sechellia]
MAETLAEEKPKEKSRASRRKDKKDKTNQVVKIVMRHLPPTMTEAQFLDQVGPLPENDSYYYCKADWSLGQEATCRAYIDMSSKDIDEVLQFRDRFDGYVFVDHKGVEYMAIVEYAPFQCFLKNKARNDDSKVNTIESESHYQEFIKRLAQEREEASRVGDVKIDFNFERRTEENVKSTPLLQYLANKKEKRREEARKRNEEKRKHREEQKLLRLAAQSDVSKLKEAEGGGGGGDTKKPTKKDGKDPQSSGSQANDAKASRSKRRTERDQRRREEHEQRKLVKRENKKDQGQGKQDKQDKQDKGKPSSGNQNKNSKTMDIVILKKANKSESNESLVVPSTSKAAEASKENPGTENTETTEDVKVFTPAARGGRKEKRSSVDKQPAGSAHETAEEAIKAAQFRASEERRIRNKDRPSIAIYQPKARIRASDELPQGAGGKDGSDGEPSVVEEKTSKRNKRPNRRNKPKPKDVKECELETRRFSKSSESSTSVK